jgi:hypothetical protein
MTSKHLKLSMNNQHSMVIINKADNCSILEYEAINARTGNVTKSSADGKKIGRFAKEYDIPADMLADDQALKDYLKEQRSKHAKKGKHNIVVANTSDQPILVKFEKGLTPGDVALITVGSVAVVYGVSAASLVAIGAGAGMIGAGASDKTAQKDHWIMIEPNTFRLFHREKTVDKISFRIRPYNTTTCPKGSKHLKLSMNDKHSMVIIKETDGCSITNFQAIKAKTGEVTKSSGTAGMAASGAVASTSDDTAESDTTMPNPFTSTSASSENPYTSAGVETTAPKPVIQRSHTRRTAPKPQAASHSW